MDGGGCERVGLGVVDHTQIDCWQTLMIDLGMAGVVSVVVVETDSILGIIPSRCSWNHSSRM